MNQTTSRCLHCSCQLQDDEGSERLPHAATASRHSLVVPCRLGFFFSPSGCMGLLEQTNQLWLSVNKSLVAVAVKRHPSSGMDGPLTARTVPRRCIHRTTTYRRNGTACCRCQQRQSVSHSRNSVCHGSIHFLWALVTWESWETICPASRDYCKGT